MRETTPSLGGYPTRVERLSIDGIAVRFLVVDDLERFVDRDALLRDANAPEPPYWAHLWTAARVLARRIARRDDWAGKRVIDIGCGLGLPGVVAAMKGATVTAFDAFPEGAAMARANAWMNRSELSACVCDLRRPPFGATFDVALAADITYDPGLQTALAAFLSRHLAPQGMAWCAESVRTHDRGFGEACRAQGLGIVESLATDIDEGRPVSVRIGEIRRLAAHE